MKKVFIICIIFFSFVNNLFANNFNKKITLKDWEKFQECIIANDPYKKIEFSISYCFCLIDYSIRNNDYNVIDEIIEKFNEATLTGNIKISFTEKTEKIKYNCVIYNQ